MEQRQMDLPKIDLFLLGALWLRNAKRCWMLGCLLVLLGTAALGWYGGRAMEPVYEAYVSVSASAESAGDAQLHAAMPQILRSDLLRREVCAYLGVEAIPAVTTTVLENAEVYTMTVRHGDPEWSWRILEAMVECAPQVARYVLGETKLVILTDSGIPVLPVKGRSMEQWLLLGGAAGAALWAVLVLVLTLCRRTVRCREELERLLEPECLGEFPRTGYAEAVRRMSLTLERELAEKQILLIAEAMPGEGAEALTAELARTLSQRGKRVLIADCSCHGPAALDRLDGAGDIRVRTAVPERAGELLTGARREYDHVLLNAPACALTRDGADLSDLADGGLLVVRWDHAAREQIWEAVALLTEGGMPLLGWVFQEW